MKILDYFFPKFCILCSKRDDYICNNCIRQFVYTLPSCYVCKKLSNGYICHKGCVEKEIQIYTCWYTDKYFQKVFDRQDKSIQSEIIRGLQKNAQLRFNTNNPFMFNTSEIDKKDLTSLCSPIYFLFTSVK